MGRLRMGFNVFMFVLFIVLFAVSTVMFDVVLAVEGLRNVFIMILEVIPCFIMVFFVGFVIYIIFFKILGR